MLIQKKRLKVILFVVFLLFLLLLFFFVFEKKIYFRKRNIEDNNYSNLKNKTYNFTDFTTKKDLSLYILENFKADTLFWREKDLKMFNCRNKIGRGLISEKDENNDNYEEIVNLCRDEFKEVEKTDQYFANYYLIMGFLELLSGDREINKDGLKKLIQIVIFPSSSSCRIRFLCLNRIIESFYFLPNDYIKEAINDLSKENKSRINLFFGNYFKENDFRRTIRNLLQDSYMTSFTTLFLVNEFYFDLDELIEKKINNEKNNSNDSWEEDNLLIDSLRKKLVFLNKKIKDYKPVIKLLSEVKSDELSFDENTLFFYYLNLTMIGSRLVEYPELVDKIGKDFIPFQVISLEEIEKIAKENLENTTKYSFYKRVKPNFYEHFARFYYAIFLNNAYGESRAEEIKSLLEPIYQMKDNQEKGIFVFLQKEKFYPNDYPHKKEIINLAKVDSRLKEMLLKAGWELE